MRRFDGFWQWRVRRTGVYPSHHRQVWVEGISLDEGVVPLVTAFWQLGIPTSFSCQGDVKSLGRVFSDAHVVFPLAVEEEVRALALATGFRVEEDPLFPMGDWSVNSLHYPEVFPKDLLLLQPCESSGWVRWAWHPAVTGEMTARVQSL